MNWLPESVIQNCQSRSTGNRPGGSRSWRRGTEMLSVHSRLTSDETCRQDRIETPGSNRPPYRNPTGLDTGLAASLASWEPWVHKSITGKTPPDPTRPTLAENRTKTFRQLVHRSPFTVHCLLFTVHCSLFRYRWFIYRQVKLASTLVDQMPGLVAE